MKKQANKKVSKNKQIFSILTILARNVKNYYKNQAQFFVVWLLALFLAGQLYFSFKSSEVINLNTDLAINSEM